MMFLESLAVGVGVVAVYLGSIVFLPILEVTPQPIKLAANESTQPKCRRDVTFEVDGQTIRAWLYLPEKNDSSLACVVMNNGFCGTKDMVLEPYALKFVEAGYAALTFDYRHFGESDGEPRQLLSLEKQLEDAHAAIAYARSRPEIDPSKIVAWGTSSTGSFGILLAGADTKIAAIIGQTPSLDHQVDGKKILKRDGMGWFLGLIMHAQRDKGRSRFGLSEHTFPAAGKPGTAAMLIGPGVFEGYERLAEHSTTFRNEVCARLMFDSHGPNLLESAGRINCPAQFHLCEYDEINSPDTYGVIEGIMGDKVEFIRYPTDHFGIYKGEHFENSTNNQIEFLNKTTKE